MAYKKFTASEDMLKPDARFEVRDAKHELLTVIGILSVLLGLSISYLGRTDPKRIADAVMRGELRAAQLTARADGVPTEVWLRPGLDGQPDSVQSRLLRPVVTFHCEPKEEYENDVLRPTIAGEDVPGGRFGHALRPAADGKEALLRWPAPPRVLDVGEGFVVRLDLLLERRTASTVLRLPPAIDLSLDAEGRPHARFRIRATSGDKALVGIVSDVPLPVAKWCTLEAGCDGRTAWLSWDGRVLASAVADGAPEQNDDAVFEVCPADSAMPGLVDELRWFVYALAPAQFLPREAHLDRSYRFAFDARGEAVAEPTVNWGWPEEAK